MVNPLSAGPSKSKSKASLVYGLPSSSTFMLSNHAVPLPDSNCPNQIAAAFSATGISSSYCFQSVVPFGARFCRLANARGPVFDSPSTRHQNPAYPLPFSVLINPLNRTRLPRASSTGKVPVAEPKSACATAGGASASSPAWFRLTAYSGSTLATKSFTMPSATLGVCMSNPVNSTRPLPLLLNSRIVHRKGAGRRAEVGLCHRRRRECQFAGLVQADRVLRVHLGHEILHDAERHIGRLHVEPRELDAPFAALVELAHPSHHIEHFLRVPSPEVHALDQLRRVALTLQHEIVQLVGFRHVGLDREDGEAHLGGQELQHAVLQLEELPRSVSRLAQRHNPRLAHHLLQWLHVLEAMPRFRRGQADRVAAHPLRHRRRGLRHAPGDRKNTCRHHAAQQVGAGHVKPPSSSDR